MKKIDFNWYNAGGQKIYARIWQPDNKPDLKGVICVVHGLGEHCNRYDHVARFFVQNNYAVLACDLCGHGQSEGKRGHVSSFNAFFEQIDRMLEEASKRFPGEPKFMYGHSMGGNITLNYLILRNPRLLGAVISAPWLRPAMEIPSSKLTLAKIANILLPSYLENNGIDVTQLSRDAGVVDAYKNDPLVHDKISARLFSEGTSYAQHAMNNAAQLRMPVLLMHGTKDGLTDYHASEEFAQLAGSMLTFKTWEGFYHELHNEPEKDEVLAFVLKWIDEKQKKSTELS
ncbi:MAG TPA: lysophospholipase [Chitinophagales bacterium]|mgnify:CR=1 FL=1|nr:lysophospholipase [Chitinophagales bacterium]